MIFREANVTDVQQMQYVRNAVKENMLSNPAIVTDEDCEEYITVRGKGWVCDIEKNIVGFAIADLKWKSVWALFVKPGYDKKGIGKKLYDIMMQWYFNQTKEKVWLTTASNTRAEKFYRNLGWIEVERKFNGEIKFELTYEDWIFHRHKDAKPESITKMI